MKKPKKPKKKIIRIEKRRDGKFYWFLAGRNGETMGHAQGFSRKASARRSAQSIIDAGRAGLIEIEEPKPRP